MAIQVPLNQPVEAGFEYEMNLFNLRKLLDSFKEEYGYMGLIKHLRQYLTDEIGSSWRIVYGN